jgi:sulfate adenylyltransferase subunit 1
MSAIEHLPEFGRAIDHGLLRLLTCGSVDDGKSTLIGRLLYDTKAILADTLHAIERASRKRGLDAADLSLLTDGLVAEREQGITIDVAYRYFSTGTRKYIIADAPGHEQYTRNMATAASTADLAIIMIDARKGMLTQTRRHSMIGHLLDIRHLIVAVNKMDLVAWCQDTFQRIVTDYLAFAKRFGIEDVRFIPLSALSGDMVVERGDHLDWYQGPTLLDILEVAPAPHENAAEPFRFPVQYVSRPHLDFRGYMGRIESGEVQIGDEIEVLPSGRTSRITGIQMFGRSLSRARAEQSITLLIEDEIDISRGDMLVHRGQAPERLTALCADLCWLSERPLDARRRYLLQHTTREIKAKVAAIGHRIDMDTLHWENAAGLAMNDIAQVSLHLAGPIFADDYLSNRATGAFILIDEVTNNTVAAGMIRR